MKSLLIHPPHAKAAEPPAGLPLLVGVLRQHGQQVEVCDLNMEGFEYLLGLDCSPADTWSKRAEKNRAAHLSYLRSPEVGKNAGQYNRAVSDLNRSLENRGRQFGVSLSITNYQNETLSPQRSGDLLTMAENPERDLFYPYFSIRLSRLIEETNPSLVGLSINYLSQALSGFAVAGFLRKRFPELKLIAGGGLITTWLQNPNWDDQFSGLFHQLIDGPGEGKLLEAVGKIDEPCHALPDYTDLLHNRYLSPGLVLPYSTSTGCYWRKCSFCPETSEMNRYQPIPTATVAAEIATLAKSYRPALLHFVDNAIRPEILTMLSQSERVAPWYGFVRFTRQLTDPDFCRLLRQSGCVMLKLGLESGSQRVLDELEKGIDLSAVTRALHAIHQAGIMTYVYLLFGTPAEHEEDADKTLNFVKAQAQNISFLNLAIFNLPSCSKQVHSLRTREFSAADLPIYTDFVHPYGWDRASVRRFLDTRFKKEKEIQQILRSDPPHFTSNHAPFFHGVYGRGGKHPETG